MAEKTTREMTVVERMMDKMTPKQKEILKVQRSLLSKNIVWTPILANSLKERLLLTEAMIAQIGAVQGPENKILMMLDLLPLRTHQVYDKFADALHVSGHTLLADFLREEDLSEHPLDLKDMFKRLPFLTRNMKEPEKKEIEDYVSEKVQSAILAHTWQWNTKDKDKALLAKEEQVNQAFTHTKELNKKELQVQEAERIAREAREESQALREELRAMADSSNRVQQNMKGQIVNHMKFSLASDNIAQRTTQRLKVAEETLKTVQDKLQSAVKLKPREKEREQMKMAENPFYFLPEDTDIFLSHFKKLVDIQNQYEQLMEERNSVLTHLGFPPPKVASENQEHKAISMLKVFMDFAFQKDEEIGNLKQEAARQTDLLEQLTRAKEEEERKMALAGTVWQNAIMSVMRKQLQDLKGAIRKKDTTLSFKEEEIVKLRSKVNDLEQSLTSRTQEAELATRAINIIELQGPSVSDGLVDLTAGGGTNSPKVTSSTAGHNLPPIRSSSISHHLTSSSPRPAVLRASHHHQQQQQRTNNNNGPLHHPHQYPRAGVVMDEEHSGPSLPAGLSTMQIKVHREDSRHGAFPFDPRNRAQMGSTLGDLKAMHGHHPSKFPVSRGGGSGVGLEGGPGPGPLPVPIGTKRMPSPNNARRKVAGRVK